AVSRRFAVASDNSACPLCICESFAAAQTVCTESAAAHPCPVSRLDAGGEVRYLSPVAQHETVASKGVYIARERGARPHSARACRSCRSRSSCAASARQDRHTWTHHQF